MAIRSIIALCILVSSIGAAASGSRIHLKSADFDPLVTEQTGPTAPATVASQGQRGFHILQFTGPVQEAWKDAVRGLGIELVDYIPDFAFVVRATPEMLRKARDLSFVRWTGAHQPAFRMSPHLAKASGDVRVSIQLFPGEATDAVEADVKAAGGIIHSSSAGIGGARVVTTVPAQALSQLTGEPGVAWIEPYVEPRLLNDVARGLMDVPSVWTNAHLFGVGEIVAIADTGLDTGSLSTISADFSGRVIKTYALGRVHPSSMWDDPVGHGTHVAGSVLGSGVLSGSSPSTHSYASSFAGLAPEAQLDFQSILDSSGGLGGLPSDLNQLFQPTYNDGARIHTNSWGAPVAGVYDTDARNVDVFTWNNKDMTILFAAGNDGVDSNSNGVVDSGSIDSPGTAKNCITVGATENLRLSGGAQGTYGGYWGSSFPVNPIYSDRVSDNASGLAAFSSRGPTSDGRIKPDIVAPGTNVLSCRSHDSGAGTLWGAYNADYAYSGGTSMATPLTAGAAALVRQYYRTVLSHAPTAALVKATLINGATDLYPGQYGTGSTIEIPTTRPNNAEGWGRVDLGYVMTPPTGRQIQYVDNTSGLYTGGNAVYTYSVADSAGPLRITLAWTDYPASTVASKALVNDLDLTVVGPDASTYHGNGAVDRTNNVEDVDIAVPLQGTYTVSVKGYNVPIGPQPFALVVSADIGLPMPTASITAPVDSTALDGKVTVQGTAAGYAFQQYQLDYGSGSAPTSWTAVAPPQTTPVTSGALGTWNTAALASGTYTLRLTVTNPNGSSQDRKTVNVLKTSVSAIRNSPDGTLVTLTGKLVSAGPGEFGATMFIEDLSRTAGIRVNLGLQQISAPIGSTVTVSGTLQTANGERVIVSPSVTVTGT